MKRTWNRCVCVCDCNCVSVSYDVLVSFKELIIKNEVVVHVKK